MTTTRAILLSTAGLTLLGVAAFATLQLRLPFVSLFEYGTGTLVTTGLVTMMIGTERTPRRRAARPAPGRPTTGPRREAPLFRSFAPSV